jgi:hypothetical protein
LVFEIEFSFLEALQLELILGGALREAGDHVIEVPVFRLKLVNFLLESLDVGGMYHGRIPPYQRALGAIPV